MDYTQVVFTVQIRGIYLGMPFHKLCYILDVQFKPIPTFVCDVLYSSSVVNSRNKIKFKTVYEY